MVAMSGRRLLQLSKVPAAFLSCGGHERGKISYQALNRAFGLSTETAKIF
jgi:hypothetical protein